MSWSSATFKLKSSIREWMRRRQITGISHYGMTIMTITTRNIIRSHSVRSRVGQRRGDGLLGLTNDLGFFSRGVGNICAIHIGKAFGFVVTNDISRTLERDWEQTMSLTPTVKTLEAARFKLETMRNKPNIANGTSQKFLVYPIQLRHQSDIRSVRGAIQTLPDGVMAKYAANLVTIPESILYEFPSIRLEVWYFHYFRNLIIFQTKHGAETFIDFHRKRIQHYRNSRHQSRQQSARAEYEVSVALLEYPIRCVDDPNFSARVPRNTA